MKQIPLWIALAVGALSFVFLWRHQNAALSKARGGDTVAVLVAQDNVERGEILDEDMLAIRKVPSRYLDSRHVRLTDSQKVLGVSSKNNLRRNEALLWSDVASNARGERFSEQIVEGMRAMTLSTTSVPTLAEPGDRVDLFVRRRDGDALRVETVLQRVLILAIGQRSSGTKVSSDTLSPRNGHLTVSIDASDSRLLALAQGEGELFAVLRSPEDIVLEPIAPQVESSILAEQGRRRGTRDKSPIRESEEIEHVR